MPITRPAQLTADAEAGMSGYHTAVDQLLASYRKRRAAGDDRVHAGAAIVVACLAVMEPDDIARTLAAAVVKLAEQAEPEMPFPVEGDEPFDCAPECRCKATKAVTR